MARDWRRSFPELGNIPNYGNVNNPTTYITDILIQIPYLEMGAIGIPSQTTARYIKMAYNNAKQNCCDHVDIYVVAHSQGAAILNQALPLLTDDEKKALRIMTIGGEQFVREDSTHFGFVGNYDGNGDIVPELSPRNWFYNEINIPVQAHPNINYRNYFMQNGLPPGFIAP